LSVGQRDSIVELVRGGHSYGQVASMLKIPKTTLYKRNVIENKYVNREEKGGKCCATSTCGINTIIPREIELELKTKILNLIFMC
jgi:hypothetical protein